jgi:hypothetical protein
MGRALVFRNIADSYSDDIGPEYGWTAWRKAERPRDN